MTEVEEIILLCANDEECPLSDLISELSGKFGVGLEQAAELFLSASEFVIMREDLKIEKSEKFWVDLVEVDKHGEYPKLCV